MRSMLLVLAFAAAAGTARAATLDEYVAGLTRIDAALHGGRLDDARAEARRLEPMDIDWPNGRFHADAALLTSIVNAKQADVHLMERLETTIAELRRASTAPAAGRNDHALLDKIAREEEVAKPRAGGEAVADDELTTNSMVRFSQATSRAMKWIADKLTEFFEWLMRFWPEPKAKEKGKGGIRGIAIGVAVVIAILIAALAYAALRRSRRRREAPLQSAAPAMSARDEDPLSRGVNEWERYAAQLAAAGRTREAIRAWYHAVLVTLYSASILHFRKGRTNWEYVAMLAPSLAWRGDFVELTRRFEVEWYGLHESAEEALDECRETALAIMESVRRAGRGAA